MLLTRKPCSWQPTTEERYGRVVAAGGNSFAASAPGGDTAGTDAGAVHVYRLGSCERWASDTGIVGVRAMPPAGDWDHDGIPNLAEFGIGSNPRLGSSRDGSLAIRREGDGLFHLRLIKETRSAPTAPPHTDSCCVRG